MRDTKPNTIRRKRRQAYRDLCESLDDLLTAAARAGNARRQLVDLAGVETDSAPRKARRSSKGVAG